MGEEHVRRLVEEGADAGKMPRGFESMTDVRNFPNPNRELRIAIGAARAIDYLAERLGEMRATAPEH